MDVKKWLEMAGEPVADTCFTPGEVPPRPYLVFLDHTKRSGGDMRSMVKAHSLTVERYSDTDDDNTALEALFDAQAIKYTKYRQWLKDEGCYMTVYDLQTDLYEREVI